jgi:hypothetical protein
MWNVAKWLKTYNGNTNPSLLLNKLFVNPIEGIPYLQWITISCRISSFFHFFNNIYVATLAFGLRLRQGSWEVAGLEVDPRVTSHAPGSAKSAKSAKSVREWTLTLPSELPCWELVRVGVPKGLPKLQRAFW